MNILLDCEQLSPKPTHCQLDPIDAAEAERPHGADKNNMVKLRPVAPHATVLHRSYYGPSQSSGAPFHGKLALHFRMASSDFDWVGKQLHVPFSKISFRWIKFFDSMMRNEVSLG